LRGKIHIAPDFDTKPTPDFYHFSTQPILVIDCVPMTNGFLPNLPAIVAGPGEAVLLTAEGETRRMTPDQAGRALRRLKEAPIVLHAPATLRRLGLERGELTEGVRDLLELFAFVLPAQPVAPTPSALAKALDLDPPTTTEQAVRLLPEMARVLLQRLREARNLPLNRDAGALAVYLARTVGWGWGESAAAALDYRGEAGSEGIKVWRTLPEWEETAPPPPPDHFPVEEMEARKRLSELLGNAAEPRPGQADYAGACCTAFAPRTNLGDPHLVLAEAGTGTGKTLGYIAPASLWAERNHGAVWISTYTRHLQRQIDAELHRLFPDPAERRRRVVVRKGRENYLCLLNMEDAAGFAISGATFSTPVLPLALISRWALATEDGDLSGGDLPGWFADLFGAAAFQRLADRRGECLHAICPHFRRCFGEHTTRRARTAELVVANHALVMTQAAWGGIDDTAIPTRYVFDEGHHIFDAADSAFAVEFSGAEGAELRRWLLGAEGGLSRARGFRRRMEDLLADRPALLAPLEEGLHAARRLPESGWLDRLLQDELTMESGQGATDVAMEATATANPGEAVLRLIRDQVLARAADAVAEGQPEQAGDLECGLYPVAAGMPEAALRFQRALIDLAMPFARLKALLLALFDQEAETLDPATRMRIETMAHVIDRRVLDPLRAWVAMLRAIIRPPSPGPDGRPEYIHILRLRRREGQLRDAIFCRHPLDPTKPFMAAIAAPAHGMIITSATLRDSGEQDAEAAWHGAEQRVGAPHLPSPALRVTVASPFDYAAQTRCFIATDVGFDMEKQAAAFRALFLAAGGGALGLFTAIQRLRAVHRKIRPAMEQANLLLLAQHSDAMDNRSLVEVFRAERDSCLLGTDAMRDGVDVPGDALRMVVFERVPWPRPDIIHRERRAHLSGGDPAGYDLRMARFRLRQAFGRLIRAGTDRGVFVLLDRRAAVRIASAFPAGVEVQQAGLAEIVERSREFLRN
jgi:ATP-dependent DNA helicase DinG